MKATHLTFPERRVNGSALRYLVGLMICMWSAGTVAVAQSTAELTTLAKQAADAYIAGRYKESAEKGRKALAIAEKLYSKDHVEVATMLSNVALYHLKLNDLTTAETMFKRSLAILEKKLPPNDPKYLLTLEASLDVYWEQRRYNELVPLLKRLIEGYRATKSPLLSEGLIRLAVIYTEADRRGEALPILQEAVPLIIAGGRKQREMLPFAYHALGALYNDRGVHDTAASYFERSLASRKEIGDTANPQIVVTMANLGHTYNLMGDYEKAVVHMERALESAERITGVEPTAKQAIMQNLASLYEMLNRPEDAAALRKRAEGAAK